jgi:hypothetical protein
MSKRIHALEAEQLAAMAPHAREWTGRALATGALRWSWWESAVRACYQYAGVRWPATVVRTTSPLALARALFLAKVQEVPGDEDRALVGMVRRATRPRVDRALRQVFGPAVLGRVWREVHDPVDAAASPAAIAHGVAEALRHPVRDDPAGVRESAQDAARRLARGARLRQDAWPVPADWLAWTLHLSGQWESAWTAYASFLSDAVRTVANPPPDDRGWRHRVDVIAATGSAGWWWPHLDYVVVCDRPSEVRTEDAPDGPVRPHCDSGPAVVWPDGWSLYFWHGTLVPAWVVERPTLDAIHAESNVETRRCGIESIGWDAYITGAGLRLVDTTGDPGNPDCHLSLYDVPRDVWGSATRVLLATNGSPERDGTRRRYGLPVPADIDSAVSAAAWTYGLAADQYARLARRT